MIEIPLRNRRREVVGVALIDEADADLARLVWHMAVSRGTRYVRRGMGKNASPKFNYLHRELIKPAAGQIIDHINGDGLDNRRENLRIVTPEQNSWNSGPKSGSGVPEFKGVYLYRRRFVAKFMKKHLGYFATAEAAARAYDAAARVYQGEFARLNFPDVAARD